MLGRDVIEDRRLDEVAFAEMLGLFTAEQQTSAFLLPDPDIVEIGFPLLLVHRRSHIHGFVQTGADFDFFGALR